MTTVGLGQQSSEAVGPDSNFCFVRYFRFSLTFVRNSIPVVPMAQWVVQKGFKAVGTGSSPSLYLHFRTYISRRKIVIPPPPLLMHENFRYQTFSETRKGSCTKCFGTIRQKNPDRNS